MNDQQTWLSGRSMMDTRPHGRLSNSLQPYIHLAHNNLLKRAHFHSRLVDFDPQESHLTAVRAGRDRTGIIPRLYGDRQRLLDRPGPAGCERNRSLSGERTSRATAQSLTRHGHRRKCNLMAMLLTTTCDPTPAMAVLRLAPVLIAPWSSRTVPRSVQL